MSGYINGNTSQAKNYKKRMCFFEMSNMVKAVKGVSVDNALLKKYKPGREEADQRLVDILYFADRLRDEASGWFCLAMMREYLIAVPANSNLDDLKPFSRIDYLSYLFYLVDCLNKHQFCRACNELSDMIRLGCTAYANIRDAILHILIEHKNMDYAQAAQWF